MEEKAEVGKPICDKTFGQVKIFGALLPRGAAAELIEHRFGICLPTRIDLPGNIRPSLIWR